MCIRDSVQFLFFALIAAAQRSCPGLIYIIGISGSEFPLKILTNHTAVVQGSIVIQKQIAVRQILFAFLRHPDLYPFPFQPAVYVLHLLRSYLKP